MHASPLGTFLAGCGMDGPFRLDVDGPDDLIPAWELPQPFAVVGRAPEADVRLDEPSVSRAHAYFQVVAGRVFCVDLHSRTGTRWGDRRSGWGWVEPGEEVGIGPFRVRPCVRPGPAAGVGADPGRDDPLPVSRSFGPPLTEAVALAPVGPEGVGAPRRVSRAVVLVGRTPACKVRITDRRVAAIHAAVVRTPGGLWVVDLHRPDGVRVNGERVRAAELQDGDVVSVGPHDLRVHRGPSAERLLRDRQLPVLASGAAVLGSGPPPGGGPGGAVDPTVKALIDQMGRMQEEMAEQFQRVVMGLFQAFAGMHREQTELIRGELSHLERLAVREKELQAALGRAVPDDGKDRPALRLVFDPPDVPAALPAPPRAGGVPSGAPADPEPPHATGPGGEEVHKRLVRRLAALRAERRGRWRRLLESLGGGGTGEVL